ncbi:MAG: class I SAM-dependent methyltransferase [Burkholderiales bacterium]|nr:MAG: class I SAM-dependent methyltransferase [Burkholderiales bacterium]
MLSPAFRQLVLKHVVRPVYGAGGRRHCRACGRAVLGFLPYAGGSRNVPEFIRRLDLVGSNVDQFACALCGATDRERHLLMYFDALRLWDGLDGAAVLHIAPERKLAERLAALPLGEYVPGDLSPRPPARHRIDVTRIDWPDAHFDLVICNHVLEHVPDYRRAIAELYRVTRPGGTAILQAPYSRRLAENFEDSGIDDDRGREFFYGQSDHVRVFSETGYLRALEEGGFRLGIARHADLFGPGTAERQGVNALEDLIRVTRPA